MDMHFEPRGTALAVVGDVERRNLAAALLEETHARVLEASCPDGVLEMLQACPDEIDFAFVDLAEPDAARKLAGMLARRSPRIPTVTAESLCVPHPWRAIDLLIAAERCSVRDRRPGRFLPPRPAGIDRRGPVAGWAR